MGVSEISRTPFETPVWNFSSGAKMWHFPPPQPSASPSSFCSTASSCRHQGVQNSQNWALQEKFHGGILRGAINNISDTL